MYNYNYVNNMTDELWKPLNNGYYLISNYGNIKSIKTNKLIKSFFYKGYYRIYLFKVKMGYSIHNLVYHYFIANLEDYHEIIHLDNNKLNNYFKNLKLKKENIPLYYKKCKNCKEIKYFLQFNKKCDGKYGVRTICKQCEIQIRQNVYKNPELLTKRRLYNKKAKLKNKNNPLDILKRSLRGRIYDWCKNKNIKKNNSLAKILGISFTDFKIYIENKFDQNMNWNNYGKYWHIDHIKPLCLAKTEEEMIQLNYYTNLRPLEALENLRKSSKF